MIETAYLAGGCFWCIEGPFQQVKGVSKVVSGYMGGHINYPTYQQICTGTTGHAEVVQIEFDNRVISYQQILTIFFHLHDPTSLNQQGNDRGTQYRSAIFYQNEQQLCTAKQVIDELERQRVWDKPVVTTLEIESTFYVADEQHQQYYQNHPYQPYCQIMIAPKIAKISKLFKDLLNN